MEMIKHMNCLTFTKNIIKNKELNHGIINTYLKLMENKTETNIKKII